MLKIKDSVDLKELEKFGFDEKAYDEHKNSIFYSKNINYDYEIQIGIWNRIIIMVDRDNENVYWCAYEKDVEDLIQAGLVEKVSDEE